MKVNFGYFLQLPHVLFSSLLLILVPGHGGLGAQFPCKTVNIMIIIQVFKAQEDNSNQASQSNKVAPAMPKRRCINPPSPLLPLPFPLVLCSPS